jgi:GxxExxY protein
VDPNPLLASVVGAAYEVSNTLGCGFFEKVYERALLEELRRRQIPAQTQVPYPVTYKGHPVGQYLADLVVDSRLIVELKCVSQFTNNHIAQTLNYLKASNLHLALLLNFEKPKVEWRRVVRNL